MAETLLLGAGLSALSAAVFFHVGRVVGRRPVEGQARLAVQFFAVWWYALALVTLGGAFLSVMAAAGRTDLALFITVTHVNLTVLCLGLLGLVYYLVYLFTGSYRAIIPLAAFYLAYWASLLYFVTANHPVGVDVGAWSAVLRYEHSAGGPFFIVIVSLLLLPQILGAIAYFTLFFKATDRTQKYRIAIVSWSIIVWFGAPLLALSAGVGTEFWWQFTSRFIGLLAAVAILEAFHPAGWIQRRFHVLPMETSPDVAREN